MKKEVWYKNQSISDGFNQRSFEEFWQHTWKIYRNASFIGVSSTSGQLGSNWSGELKEQLLNEDLSLLELDKIADDFVALAKSDQHKEKGFPGTAYGTSKTLMTQLHRIIARDIEIKSSGKNM